MIDNEPVFVEENHYKCSKCGYSHFDYDSALNCFHSYEYNNRYYITLKDELVFLENLLKSLSVRTEIKKRIELLNKIINGGKN